MRLSIMTLLITNFSGRAHYLPLTCIVISAGTILLVASIIFIGLILLAFAASVNLSGSGRGLDDDEWEIHHSDWLDTLQRDFEMQWSEK